MADMFQCDQCGVMLKKHQKKGTLTLQEHDWRGGVSFPARTVHNHDLCESCFHKLFDMIRRAVRSLPERV